MINEKVNYIKAALRKLLNAGLFHIFGSTFINNIIVLLNQIMLVRIISKSEVNLYTESFVVIGYFLLFSGLGIAGGMLQYGSERIDESKRNSYFKFAVKFAFVFNSILSIALFIYTYFGSQLSNQTAPVVRLLFLYPLFDLLFQLSSVYLRVQKRNKEYSLYLNINTISYTIFTLTAAIIWGWKGAFLARYASHVISLIYFNTKYSKELKAIKKADKLESTIARGFIKYSAVICSTNFLSGFLMLIDQSLVRHFNNTSLATYTTMTKIPNALSFIPNAIMVFIYPHFAENIDNHNWLKSNLSKLLKSLFVLNGLISGVLFLIAPILVRILYGNSYSDGTPIFRMLCLNYFFLATFRVPFGNILAMLRQVKLNFIINIIVGIANIILNFILIPRFGSIGATYSYMSVVILSSIILFFNLINTLNKIKMRGNRN